MAGVPGYHSTKDLAEILGVDEWRIRRLFEAGDLPEPPRFAHARAIPSSMIPDVVDALRARDWLPGRIEKAAASSPM